MEGDMTPTVCRATAYRNSFIRVCTFAALLLEVNAVTSTAIAKFAGSGLNGTVTISQLEQSEGARIAVELDGVRPETQWSINAFPVTGSCSEASVGRIYNPSKISPDLPFTKLNQSQCLAGDLTARLGALAVNGTTGAVKRTFEDDAVALNGALSVMYRSVVLSTPKDGAYACATILPTEPAIVLEARFDPQATGLNGVIWMAQQTDSPTSDTTVLIDLNTKAGDALKDAMYHVHEGSMLTPTTDCGSLGYHFNPLKGTACTLDPESWNKCELGDISGRHGPLDLPAKGDSRLFFTDTFLPLSGPNSMDGRSLVIHNNNGQRIACATVALTEHRFFDVSHEVTEKGSNGDSKRRRLRGQ